MSIANKIFINTAWQMFFRFFEIMFGVINIGIIARVLGQAQFGYYTTIFVFLQTLITLADFGLYLALLNEISATNDKKEEKKRTDNIFTIRLLSALVVFILAPILIKIFPYDPAVKNGVIFLASAFVFQSLISTLTAVFAKYLDMARATIIGVFSKAIYLLLLFYTYQHGGSLNQILFWNSLSTGLGLILLFIFLKRHQHLGLAWDFGYWGKIFKIAWPLSVGVVLNLIYFKADTLVLSAYQSAEQVGLYGAAYKVLEVIVTFPHMFMSLVLPIFVAAWLKKDWLTLKNIQQNTFDFFSILNVWMILVVWLMSSNIMTLVAGNDFTAAGPILNILVLAVAAIFFGTMFTYLVVALGLQKKMVKYYLLAATLALLGYFIFIPRFSYWAAAWVTVIVELFVCLAAFIFVKKIANISLNFNNASKILLAGFLSFVAFWSFRSWPVLLLGTVVSVFYFVLLFWFKVINKNKIKILLNKEKNA